MGLTLALAEQRELAAEQNFCGPHGVGMTIYRYSVVNTPESRRGEVPCNALRRVDSAVQSPSASRNLTAIWKLPRTFPSKCRVRSRRVGRERYVP